MSFLLAKDRQTNDYGASSDISFFILHRMRQDKQQITFLCDLYVAIFRRSPFYRLVRVFEMLATGVFFLKKTGSESKEVNFDIFKFQFESVKYARKV